MASEVDIANRALTKLGAARITSLTQATNSAEVMNSLFEFVRDAELRSHVWRFAIARAALPALADAPVFGYAYQYQLPSDCLRLLEVAEYSVANLNDYITVDTSLYAVEGNKLLTDLNAPLNIRYITRETDTGQYTTDFVEAFACRLAVECAETLTNSSEKRKLAFAEYQEAIRLAIRSNAMEIPSRAIHDDSWMMSRL